ncbi:MAG: hypothetical protein IT158_15850 [Bryobacterales bacterium]|nr:hypothetical protein [Bryobacterales bacterium]
MRYWPRMGSERFVGITVMPEYIQTEGIDRVLANLVKAGATAVATSPYVMEPADEKTGSREPPIDAGAGKVRLLDRPLWGRRELFVRTAPSFTAQRSLYAGLRYQPAPPTRLTEEQGGIVAGFIRAARRLGLKAYLQIQAAIPPGYRVQFGGPQPGDTPLLPDGRIPPRRLANNGSLASPHIRGYTEALIRDLARAYPEIDGIRVDWPEYPPYFLDDVFLDFSPPARAAAERLGIAWEPMRQAADGLYRLLNGGLRDTHLLPWLDPDGGRYLLARRLSEQPGIGVFLRFKALLAEELLAGFRRALSEAGGAAKELMPNAFPPPFTLASGLDFARAARHSTAISVKLYTMHWPVILRFYGEQLRKTNPGLSEPLLVKALVNWFDIADGEAPSSLADYVYPEPGDPHPAGLRAQARKIVQAQNEAGDTPVYALAHGYGPAGDFRRRLNMAYRAARRRVWINRYGYLSDEKLEVIAQACPAKAG